MSWWRRLLSKLKRNPDIVTCIICGGDYDMRDFDDVMYHMVHGPVKHTGINGKRIQ